MTTPIFHIVDKFLDFHRTGPIDQHRFDAGSKPVSRVMDVPLPGACDIVRKPYYAALSTSVEVTGRQGTGRMREGDSHT